MYDLRMGCGGYSKVNKPDVNGAVYRKITKEEVQVATGDKVKVCENGPTIILVYGESKCNAFFPSCMRLKVLVGTNNPYNEGFSLMFQIGKKWNDVNADSFTVKALVPP